MADRLRTSSTAGPTFQRAAIACQSCRSRKVKCDAQFASSDAGCGPCRRSGQECLIDPLSDGRRSVSRKLVQRLQQRIETLEALNSRAVDPAVGHPDGSPSTDTCTRPYPSTARPANATDLASAQSDDTTDPVQSNTSSNHHLDLSASPLACGETPENGSTRGESPSFFGATSHPHVVSPCDEPRISPTIEVDAVGIDLDPTSPGLRDHLFESFFKYQKLWVDVVNKECFLTHKGTGSDSRWYSRFLENAMLACGARLSTSKAVRALGSKYCEWAKDEVLKAMSEPTPANLQGFLLLSEYEVTHGNDRPGWMFCGVACRMLSDLGLHELASVVSAPHVTQEQIKESDLAYALLSACVVYEGVWTLYLGRPSCIPRSVMSIAASRCRAGRESDSLWLNAWVGLCVPMAEISHILNEQFMDDSDRATSLRRLLVRVEEWYKSLPYELSYNENRVINMDLAGYGIHTQYCKVQILLRQALSRPRNSNSRKRRHSQISRDKDPWAPSDDSDIIIYRYALRIARLVVTYREAFGVEQIPSIMLDNAVVAATEMIEHLTKEFNGQEIQQQKIWLRHLVKSMETVQPHFPIVGRMLDSLRQIGGSSGLLCSMLPYAPTRELPVPSEPVDFRPALNNAQDNSFHNAFAIESDLDIAWDCIDTDTAPNIFASSGIDDFLHNIASSGTLISSF